jgi:hypothetical protein
MSEKRWDDMYTLIRPYAPDAPELAVIEAIKSTATDFFEKTHTWLYNTLPTPAEVGISEYELDVPKGAVLARVHQAWYDGNDLEALGEDQVQAMSRRYWLMSTGFPAFFSQQEPCTLLLLPAPSTLTVGGSLIYATLALRPSRDATGLPSELWDRYADALSYGARARLHEIPNQSFSNEEQATKFRRMYYGAVGAARADRNRGLTRAVLVVRPNRFD